MSLVFCLVTPAPVHACFYHMLSRAHKVGIKWHRMPFLCLSVSHDVRLPEAPNALRQSLTFHSGQLAYCFFSKAYAKISSYVFSRHITSFQENFGG